MRPDVKLGDYNRLLPFVAVEIIRTRDEDEDHGDNHTELDIRAHHKLPSVPLQQG